MSGHLTRIGTVGRDTYYVSVITGAMYVRTRFASGNVSKLRSAGAYAERYTVDTATAYVMSIGGDAIAAAMS